VEKEKNKKEEPVTSFADSLANLQQVRAECSRLDEFMASWAPGDMPLNVEVELEGAGYREQFATNAPELFVAVFLDQWRRARYHEMVGKVWYPSYTKLSEMIGIIRRMYEGKHLVKATLLRKVDEAPGIVEVFCEVTYSQNSEAKIQAMCFRLVYQDAEGLPLCRIEPEGRWVAWKGLYDIEHD
jgi:hypothetical protein